MSATAATPTSQGPVEGLALVWPVALGAFGIAALVTLVLVPVSRLPSRYGAASFPALDVSLTAGAVLIVVGVAGSLHREYRIAGRLLGVLGLSWLAGELVGAQGISRSVRSAAMVVELFLVPVLLHLGLTYPGGRTRGSAERRIIVVAYIAAAAVGIGRALWYDPIRDLDCWRLCSDNVFLVSPQPGLAHLLGEAWLWFVVLAGAVLAARMAGRLGGRRSPYVFAVVGLAAVAEVARAGLLLVGPAEDPTRSPFLVLFVVRGVLLALVGGAIGWDLSRAWRMRRALETLARDLEAASAPGALESILARGLDDATLEVGYWLPHLGRYVDAAGMPFEPARRESRAVATIRRAGDTLGVVVHDPALSLPDVEREIGSAARLAVDNERLRAELLAQMSEIRSSQARIVEAGDLERRRIERDLHDGAQQRLLALSFQLRMAHVAAEAAGDTNRAEKLATATAEVLDALAELRSLAHGIFPSTLADGGLAAALSALRDEAQIVVDVDVTGERFDPGVEMAAYLAVVEAMEAAVRASAGRIAASAHAGADSLRIGIATGKVPLPPDELVHVADRVGALGGSVDFSGNTVRVVIPCG